MDFEAWQLALPIDYPKREFLLAGIKDGFHIVDADKIQNEVECKNYKSATNPPFRDKVETQILDELAHGHYKFVQDKPTIVSALGAIPKKDSHKVRLIHDCSRPEKSAVNDFAYLDKFHYQTIQDAVDLITPGAYLAKCDLSNAYRSVRIHPSNCKATGLKWCFQGESKAKYMCDTRLPFGAAASPQIFHEITQAVCYIMRMNGFPGIVCYLDDFIVISKTYEKCKETLNSLLVLLRFLGFSINYSKIEGPSQSLIFLGIIMDTVSMTLTLPPNKLEDLHNDLNQVYKSEKVSKRQLQRLAGKLNWATQCIYGGRFYLRRILDHIHKLRAPWHKIRVNKEVKKDLMWWLHYMSVFNGSVHMVDSRPAAPVSIDACNKGAGAFFMGDWVYTRWDETTAAKVHINSKEIMALEPAVARWGPCWANKKIFVHSDNKTAVAAINKGHCKDPIAMKALRHIFWYSVMWNFRLRAKYYPGNCNKLADAVSRLETPGGWQRLNSLLSSFVSR